MTAITEAYNSGALVEEFIGGREFNATVMGNSQCVVLPVSEIVYTLPPEIPRILTFAAKWEPDSIYFKGTKVICPAEVSEPRTGIYCQHGPGSFPFDWSAAVMPGWTCAWMKPGN